MRAADALCEALKAEGVKHVFGIPGGASLPLYDALYDARLRAHSGPSRTVRRTCRRGLREGLRPGRRRFRDLGSRSDEPRHRDRRRLHGLRPDRLHHRPGPNRPDRHRRLPGGRHHRHDASDRQALLPRHRSGADTRLHPRRIPHRQERTSRPGPTRHPPGPLADGDQLRADHRQASPARLPAQHRGQHQADPGRRPGAGELASTGALRGRRRDQRRCLRGAARARRLRRPARHLHADGPRSLPGSARAVARNARDARHPRRQLRDGRGRPDRRHRCPLRRSDHRQAERVRAPRQVRPHRHRSG